MNKGQVPSIGRDFAAKRGDIVLAAESTECSVCGAVGAVDRPLFQCSGCLGVFYCGRRCPAKRGLFIKYEHRYCTSDILVTLIIIDLYIGICGAGRKSAGSKWH